MPVYKEGDTSISAWGDVEAFSFIEAEEGVCEIDFLGPKERYFVVEGEITVRANDETAHYAKGGFFDPPRGARITINGNGKWKLCRVRGNWGEELGGSGIFGVTRSDVPQNPGFPANYPRNTSFDNHYHDCDEYWILFIGSGTAYSEGQPYDVSPGDCIATRAGDYHDFPICAEQVEAVFFETTLKGQKRTGHLWT